MCQHNVSNSQRIQDAITCKEQHIMSPVFEQVIEKRQRLDLGRIGGQRVYMIKEILKDLINNHKRKIIKEQKEEKSVVKGTVSQWS